MLFGPAAPAGLSVRRPMLLVVLKACVIETKETPLASKASTFP
jgi:hypothetical protein